MDGLLFARAMLASVTAAAAVSLSVSLFTMATLPRWTLGDLGLYFIAFYFWCFFVSTAFGLPGYVLARWRGVDNAAVAAGYGGAIGLGFGGWIGGGDANALSLYGTLGVMGGVVFLLTVKYSRFFRDQVARR